MWIISDWVGEVEGAKNKDGRNKRPPLAHQRAFLHVRMSLLR